MDGKLAFLNLLVFQGFSSEGFENILLLLLLFLGFLEISRVLSIRPFSMSAFSRDEGVPHLICGRSAVNTSLALVVVGEDG